MTSFMPTSCEKYLLRKIIVKAEEIKMHAEDNEKDIYKVISETHSVLSALMDVRPSMATDIEDIRDSRRCKKQTSKLIKTGYHKIDAFSGGLTRGEITIWVVDRTW